MLYMDIFIFKKLDLVIVIFIFKKLDLIKDITFWICMHWDMYARKFSDRV